MELDVLGLIKNNQKIKINEISNITGDSINTINKQIRKLKDANLLTDNRKVSTKGESFLSERKVKNAIILAAGWGSRMSPVTDSTPKPLVKIFGKPMIETTIESLHKKEIKDITIVVGKFAEQFEYLKNKYGVNLILNKEWNTRNNIGSLHKAKHLLDNSLLLEGDAPIKNHNILLNYINDPIFYGSYFEGKTAEWTFKMNGNNIISIAQGGMDSYIWKGGWYINKKTAALYRSWFDKNYEDPRYENSDAAYILINILKKENLKLRLYRIKDNDMTEIDTYKELCEVDDSYKGLYE